MPNMIPMRCINENLSIQSPKSTNVLTKPFSKYFKRLTGGKAPINK